MRQIHHGRAPRTRTTPDPADRTDAAMPFLPNPATSPQSERPAFDHSARPRPRPAREPIWSDSGEG